MSNKIINRLKNDNLDIKCYQHFVNINGVQVEIDKRYLKKDPNYSISFDGGLLYINGIFFCKIGKDNYPIVNGVKILPMFSLKEKILLGLSIICMIGFILTILTENL